MNAATIKRYRLSRDVAVTFSGYQVTAPKGTTLQYVKDATGAYWKSYPAAASVKPGDMLAIPPNACDAGGAGKAGTWSLFGHDSKYRYIWAPRDAVEEF